MLKADCYEHGAALTPLHQLQNVAAKAEPSKHVAAAASAPEVAPPAIDFELSRILEADDSELPEALNFDLQMPDMSKVSFETLRLCLLQISELQQMEQKVLHIPKCFFHALNIGDCFSYLWILSPN